MDKAGALKHRQALVFTSAFVPILTYGYGHESWVTIERILSQVQAPQMGFLRRVHGVTKGRTEVRLRPGQETRLEPSNVRHCCDFSAPPSDSASVVLSHPRYAPGVTLRNKVRSCEIRRTLNVEPLLLIERTPLKLVGPCIQNAQRQTSDASPAG